MNLALNKFNMRSILFRANEAEGPIVVLLGSRGTGKSVLIKDMMFYHKDIPVGTVISGTEDGNGFFGKLMPRIFIHDEYDISIIENVLRRQQIVMKTWSTELTNYRQSAIDPRTFLIMDDCLYDDRWTREKLVRYIFMNGRHRKIMFVISMQHPLGIPPVLRTNIDYTFILRETNQRNRRTIYENYAGMFPTFETFCQVMDQCTNNFECLVVKNRVQTNRLQDQVFWYKADTSHPEFQIGAPEYWEMSRDIERSQENFDPSKMRKKTSARIDVQKRP